MTEKERERPNGHDAFDEDVGPMVATRGSDQFPVRFPPGLRAAVKAEAKKNGRSMNTEIIARLMTMEGPTEGALTVIEKSKTRTLTIRLTDAMHERLHAAATSGPYELSLTSIVERGIELAAAEIDEMFAKAKK